MDVVSVDMVEGYIKVRGKGNKDRVVPFGDELRAELQKYLSARECMTGDKAGPLFVDDKCLDSCRAATSRTACRFRHNPYT